MVEYAQPQPRQLWGQVTASASKTSKEAMCTPFELPAGGVLVFNNSYSTTLGSNVQFIQPCELANITTNPGNTTIDTTRDPFYASSSPQFFAIATATVISYLLVILIFITPRTFYIGGPGGGAGFLGRRGGINGASGGSAVVGVGRRPWLQKIATITVAISLTIATADTFKKAQEQYEGDYLDSGKLVDSVVGSLEIRVVRLISDTFLWLAQVQTLIRLFPRHKEKVTIKWLGFVLVSFDTIFSILNDFVGYSPRTRPRSFQDAIPALSYLFELAISLIYASCVIYYSLSKRRFAFWHPKMRNVCLVAALSLMAVLVPVVFFVLDVSKPNVAGWGDYIRWVGAAAASVVVWEWVERIEALERDERKNGILGREIFDGDEMLNDVHSEQADWPGRRDYWNEHGFPSDEPRSTRKTIGISKLKALKTRIPFSLRGGADKEKTPPVNDADNQLATLAGTNQPAVPSQAVTPISRSDTASAGSTVYAVRYHNVVNHSPAIPEETTTSIDRPSDDFISTEKEDLQVESADLSSDQTPSQAVHQEKTEASTLEQGHQEGGNGLWRAVANPFKRKRTLPPAEVAGAQISQNKSRRSPIDVKHTLRSRVGLISTAQRTKIAGRGAVLPMAVTVIPAQRRGHRTWSPEDFSNQPLEGVDEMRDAEATEDDSEARHVDIVEPISGPFSEQQQQEMSVTVIPAPRRGQRTWSPDDIIHTASPTLLDHRTSPPAVERLNTTPKNLHPQRNQTPQTPSISNRSQSYALSSPWLTDDQTTYQNRQKQNRRPSNNERRVSTRTADWADYSESSQAWASGGIIVPPPLQEPPLGRRLSSSHPRPSHDHPTPEMSAKNHAAVRNSGAEGRDGAEATRGPTADSTRSSAPSAVRTNLSTEASSGSDGTLTSSKSTDIRQGSA